MKKVIIALTLLLLLCTVCVGLSACGGLTFFVDKLKTTEPTDTTLEVPTTTEGATTTTEVPQTSEKPTSKLLAFELNEEDSGYYVLTGIGLFSDTDIVIPRYVYGKLVTSISDFAFSNCTALTSITIPDCVTSIGEGAFRGCESLTSITVDKNNPIYHSEGNCLIETESKTLIVGCQNSVIPDSVTSIDAYAFNRCTRLTSIIIPDSVTSISPGAFRGCESLTSITIPFVGVVDVSSNCLGCFFDTTSKSNLKVPASLKSVVVTGGETIGSDAFRGCTSLTSVTIPDSATAIGDGAFYGCTSLTSITIPKSVTSIGSDAFSGCTSLASITLPDSVTWLGERVFYGCTSLTSVVIPDSVTTIYAGTFSGCTSLTIYCEAESKPSGWGSNWNHDNRPVVWGYKGE